MREDTAMDHGLELFALDYGRFEIAEGKRVVPVAGYLIVSGDRVVLVDTGFPARYVSGYLFARRDDAGSGANADGSTDPKTEEADAVRVQTHAWVEVAVAPGRWQALDPTNGRDVGERYVKIGHGRDYQDVAPIRGVYQGVATAELSAGVRMRRVTDPE